ncbi:MAG: right-handed parallel beta-helix repeat-containing protein [Lentisphaeria bacterium]|nr:right-handed parallel beta-helix repeat-containing protein [Lentisphaeria bacterium]
MKIKQMVLMMSAAVLASFVHGAEPEKVAQVMAGELKEARVSWWGFNPEDSTEFLEAAINSKVPKVIIDKQPSPWILGKTLLLVSNQEIVFEEGVELLAKKGCFKGRTDCMLRLRNIQNVTLRGEGKGATVKMRKADYHTAEYEKAEWRHCVSILSSQNLKILNLNMVESGGDGIYLGIATQNSWPENIVIKDVVCDGNNRQGISVISGVNVLVENVKMINTKGTAPEAGIDFEPNRANEPIRNFVMRNCETRNNAGAGYEMYLPNMASAIGPLEITFENCVAVGDRRSPFVLISQSGPGKTISGQVTVRNCEFRDAGGSVTLRGTSPNGFKTLFDGVKIRNCAKNNGKSSAILVNIGPKDIEPAGNIEFRNVTVEDDVARDAFSFIDGGAQGGLRNISGSVTANIQGKESVMEFSDEWAKATYPPTVFRSIEPFSMDGKTLEPVNPQGVMTGNKLADLRIRHAGEYWFYAKAGETIRFTIEYGQLVKLEGSKASVSYKTPSGKTTQLEAIPFKTVAERVIANVPETGIYIVVVDAGRNWSRLIKSDHPVVSPVEPFPCNLVAGGGNRFFYVPEGTKEFGVCFRGDGVEGLKATVFAPDGSQIWQKDDISRMEQLAVDGDLAMRGGVFRVFIQAPTHLACIEDHYMRLDGIPPYIAADAAFVMKAVDKK